MPNFQTAFSAALLLILSIPLSAQVTLSLKRPVGKDAYLPDLYNLTIVNKETAQQVYLRLEVEEQQAGIVGIIHSADFPLSEGISTYDVSNYQELGPLKVIRIQEKYKAFTLQNNQLPSGRYSVCIYLLNSREQQELTKDCYTLSLESFLPPYLISPANQDTVYTRTPFFFWSPASPSPSKGNFAYTLLISEILYAQSAVAAIKSNRFWIRKEAIPTPSFQYPEYARDLEEGQPYAWQVIAYLNGEKIAESEVGSFSYSSLAGPNEDDEEEDGEEEKNEEEINRQTYYALSPGPAAGFYRLREPYLPFIYDNPYPTEKPAVQLLDIGGNIMYEGEMEEEQQFGLNKNIVDLSAWGALQPGTTYLFKLTNQQGKTYQLRFNYEPVE